jgi:hypothetical protein
LCIVKAVIVTAAQDSIRLGRIFRSAKRLPL